MEPYVREAVRSYLGEKVARANRNKAITEYRAASNALKNAKRSKVKSNIRKARHRHTVAFRRFLHANERLSNVQTEHFWDLHELQNQRNINVRNANRLREIGLAQLARKLQRWALRARFHPSRMTAKRLVNEANREVRR